MEWLDNLAQRRLRGNITVFAPPEADERRTVAYGRIERRDNEKDEKGVRKR